MQADLQYAEPDHQFVCTYNPSTGSITVLSQNVTMFNLLIDVQVMTSTIPEYIIWKNQIGNDVYVDLYNLKSLNDVIRHTNITDYHPSTIPGVSSFVTGFIDLFNIHSIYIHSSNLGHYIIVSVSEVEITNIKVFVGSSFGDLVMDSVVAPHDKIDVSRQLIGTLNFILKNVHGNVIDLHAAQVSLSMVFVTID